MKRLFKNLWLPALGAIITLTSCSDDEKDYPKDVFYTGKMEVVKVISSSGSGDKAINSPAFKLSFTASGNWNLQAKPLAGFENQVDWVSFYQNSGEEGSQLIGVYVAPNPEAKDRVAMIEISCNGTSSIMTLVQQANGVVANPNATSIDASKVIASVEKKYNDKESTTLTFGYDANGILSSVESTVKVPDAEDPLKSSAEIVTESKVNKDGKVEVSEVSYKMTSQTNAVAHETVAIVNGIAAIGFTGTETNSYIDQTTQIQNFNYADGRIKEIKCHDRNYAFTWNAGNMTQLAAQTPAGPVNVNLTYGAEVNNTNLDLNGVLTYLATTPAIFDPMNLLATMNLLGKRSASLPATLNTEKLTYADGVTTAEGQQPGMTITATSQAGATLYTIKVLYAKKK